MNQDTKPIYMSIRDAASYLGLSVDYIRKGIASGKFTHVCCGRKFLVNITKMIDTLEQDSQTAPTSFSA